MKRSSDQQAQVRGLNRRNKSKSLLESLESRLLYSMTPMIPMPSAITTKVSVAPVTVNETNATTQVTLTALLDSAITSDLTLKYSTSNGSAKKGLNYRATSSSLIIPEGSTSGTFTIPILANDLYQGDTTFYVHLSVKKGNTIEKRRVAVTIHDDDSVPTVTVSDISVDAGKKGQTVSIPVTLSNPSSKPVKIHYTTQNDTAIKGKDYRGGSGTLTIKPGQTTKSIKLRVLKDTVDEVDESFDVQLTSAKNGDLTTVAGGTEHGRVAIREAVDSDVVRPMLTVSNAAANAGEAATFTVTLSAASDQDVTVRYHTVPGTATTEDYTLVDSVLTIPAGSISGTITVQTNASESNEDTDFTLVLTAPANADLTNTTAAGTILAELPGLSISSPSVTEGDSGTSTLTFTVTLSRTSTSDVTVDYATSNGTATDGDDYTGDSGTLTFAPGETSKTISVLVTGDTTIESDETLLVTLSDPTHATITTGTGTGTIENDDLAGISIAPASVTENGANITNETMTYTVTLDNPAPFPVTVHYATSDGTAIAGTDYNAANGTLTFAPGETSKTIDVTVTGDSVAPGETFNVTLSNATNGVITSATGVGTINYIAGTDLSDNLAEATNGGIGFDTTQWPSESFNTGPSRVDLTSVTIPLQMNVSGSVSMMVYSDNGGLPGSLVGTLTSPTSYSTSDFANATFTASGITLDANTTYWILAKALSGDFVWECSATSNGTGIGFMGTTKVALGSGSSWVDNIPMMMQVRGNTDMNGPGISIAPASVAEVQGADSTQTMSFTVTLDNAAPFPVTVQYATSDGTAAAGTDYSAANGTLTFAPGETSKTISVTVNGISSSSDETLFVNLSNATNATIASDTGNGTITYAGADLSDNLGQVSDGTTSISSTQWRASSFTTGASSVELSSITLRMSQFSPGILAAMIYSDNSGSPGSLVATLTAPGSFSTSGPANATFTGNGITLSGNTTYWVVLGSSGGSYGWSTTASSSGSGSGFTGGSLLSSNAGSSWISDEVHMMQVVTRPLTDLSDNLSAFHSSDVPITGNTWYAANFNAGSSDMKLSSVSVWSLLTSPGTVTMDIYLDNSGHPGTLVGTLTSPTSLPTSGWAAATFTANGIILTGNTSYWVVVHASGTFNWANTSTTTGTGAGFTGTSLKSTDSGSTWSSPLSLKFLMQVLGAPLSV